MLTVVTWKWGGRTMFHGRDYSARHVNILRNMVKRNLTIPHEFACITDDASGIDADIRIIPLWDDLREYSECFVRLNLFDPDKYIADKILTIDVDCIILDRIDHLITDEPFKIYRNPSLGRHNTRYAGGMWMMDAGVHPEVWDDFDYEEVRELRARHNYVGSDQAWLSHKIHNAPTWGLGDGVYSFKWDIRPKPTGGTCGARIVFTHGSPSGPWKAEDPSDPDLQKAYPWIKTHWR